MKTLWCTLLVTVFLFLPTASDAAGLIECGGPGEPSCQSCHVIKLANDGLSLIITLSLVLAGGVLVYAGYLMTASRGNEAMVSKAKGMFTNIGIGILIVIASWLIIDTIMKGLLPNGSINGFGPWNEISCVAQPAVNEATRGSVFAGGGVAGGTCEVMTAGPCNPANLEKYFPGAGVAASEVCSVESGGAPVASGSDLCCGSHNPADCKKSQSFSGGLFQINVISNKKFIPGCGTFSVPNGSANRDLGDCVRRNKKNGFCTGWSCKITNSTMHATCMAATRDEKLNLETAAALYKDGGFRPWTNSANKCSVDL